MADDRTPVQRTLIILKPDCVHRRLVGRLIERFENKGLTIRAIKLMRIDRALAERHYAPHQGKPFYDGLLAYITSGPVVVMVVSGYHAIDVARRLMGKTFGYQAEPGTIRGDFGVSTRYNLIHGSDSPEAAETEIALYFSPGEILDYATADAPYITRPDEPE